MALYAILAGISLDCRQNDKKKKQQQQQQQQQQKTNGPAKNSSYSFVFIG